MSRRIRIGVRAVLIGLIVSVMAAITPGLASAGAIVPCPADIDDAEFRRGDLYFYRYTVLSSAPVFKVSDGRILNNGTTVPVEQTITSSVSTTVRVVVSVGLEAKLTNEFKATVSSQIEASRTTAIGVSIKVTVPPNSNLIAEYGVQAFVINFATEMWKFRGNRGCEEWGYYPQTTTAPTVNEGWQLRFV